MQKVQVLSQAKASYLSGAYKTHEAEVKSVGVR